MSGLGLGLRVALMLGFGLRVRVTPMLGLGLRARVECCTNVRVRFEG